MQNGGFLSGLTQSTPAQALEQCRAAITAAALSGKRGLRVELLIPQLDASSRGFDRAALFTLCSGLVAQLGFAGDGARLLVFQVLPIRPFPPVVAILFPRMLMRLHRRRGRAGREGSSGRRGWALGDSRQEGRRGGGRGLAGG